jgi:hypothetical protein
MLENMSKCVKVNVRITEGVALSDILLCLVLMQQVWGKERCNLRERNHLEYPGVDGSIILKTDLKEVRCGGMDWIDLSQDKDRWRAVMYALMNFRFP